MKRLSCTVAALALAALGLTQTVTVTGVNILGGGPLTSWCTTSSSGDAHVLECRAVLNGTQLENNILINSLSSNVVGSASANIAGSLSWNVEWAGATAPSPDAEVVLNFYSRLIMGTSASGSGYSSSEENGDEIIGAQEVTDGSDYSSGYLSENEVYTSVGTWTEVSPGVWTGTTGYYTENLVADGVAGLAIPNDGSSQATVMWLHEVSVYSVGGVVVS